ncbi:MAG: glutamine-hydrolyzing carbamoyl-phosphate synthase small subunit [Clostridiales Family XIII bacterium]|nr:glutamine-hydrolyzing carbamoyl-phosphate synthase small subunit [Clostridiales Family XIII bacterium]
MDGLLLLEDGTVYRGKGFGHPATNIGELVFNTSMTGYQGILTDPSYKGQVINMTYPLIGNYGVSDIDNQSEKIHAFGLITRDIAFRPSNRCSVMGIADWLAAQRVPGIYNVDTRSITKKVRTEGTVKCLISNRGISKVDARRIMDSVTLRLDYMKDAGTIKKFEIPGEGYRIAVYDFGIKTNILKELSARGCHVVVFPYGASAEEILREKPDGLFLSNGPGDPEAASEGIEAAKILIEKLPTFGICMGHQVIGLAVGGSTYKLKFGHRGANHGVIDLDTGRSAITSQNHSYAVNADSVVGKGMAITHYNLNDGTVEGMKHVSKPVFSVQYHPEGSPGPNDSNGLFDRFINMISDVKNGKFKVSPVAGLSPHVVMGGGTDA